MSTAATGAIRREVFIEAAQATVFAFLTDPEKMVRWMGVRHEVDARPGGIYRVDVTNGNIARGEYREVTPNSRVVYSWGWEGESAAVPPGSSEVAIDLASEGRGTRLVLVHTGLPEAAVASHTHGWEHYMERLAAAAAGRDPGPDPWVKPAKAAE
jgi:uncharacterized protein YndB with AHSA1/START domain